MNWTTADGTATAGSDYTAGSGTLTFDPGVTSMPVSVDVTGDTAYEPDETFSVKLSSPTGSTVGTPSATCTITNDDKAVTTLTLKVTKTAKKLGGKGVLERATADATVTVTLYHKHHGHWTKLAAKTVGVRSLGDRDGDGVPDATYRTAFPRPPRGRLPDARSLRRERHPAPLRVQDDLVHGVKRPLAERPHRHPVVARM